MALPLSISMLRKKRDAIRDTIAAYERRLQQAQADLAHINAALRLFEASGEPEDFPPYVDLNRAFRRGETTQFCLTALQQGPMDTRQLTLLLMNSKGSETGDRVLCQTIALRVVQTLHDGRHRQPSDRRRDGGGRGVAK
ncbi:MAG: hypothetical protein HC855_11310 [Rhizobiales bacterium]|nr:hypothetical protein [Hyphomicrobiales bacterium]